MFATGVTIVTARNAAGEFIGLTANSFNSVSLAPPLVLWSLSRAAASMPAFANGSHYVINVQLRKKISAFGVAKRNRRKFFMSPMKSKNWSPRTATAIKTS